MRWVRFPHAKRRICFFREVTTAPDDVHISGDQSWFELGVTQEVSYARYVCRNWVAIPTSMAQVGGCGIQQMGTPRHTGHHANVGSTGLGS